MISIRVVCFALLVSIVGCAPSVNPVTGRPDRALMSEQDEIFSGRQIHQQVLQEYPAYKNPRVQAYVNGVGQKLASHSQRPHLPWTFAVLDSAEINAFAVQGGFVYVTRGMMAYLNSEAELAGVIGHEIGHITARHGARADRDQKIAAGAQLLAVLAGGYFGGEEGASLGAELVGAGVQTGFLLPRSREHELQADQLGAEYLHRVKFDPATMVNVIKVLQTHDQFLQNEARTAGRPNSGVPDWLRTHPTHDTRLADIRAASHQYQDQYADDGRVRYLKAIDGMTFGDGREQGVTRGQNFYHEPLGFTLRASNNWSIQNSPTVLNIVANNQQATVTVQLSPASRADHDAAIRAILKPDQGKLSPTTINGLRASNFIGSQRGKAIDATVITLRDNDFVLQKVEKPGVRSTEGPNITAVVHSFRALTAADIAAAKPYSLHTVPMPAGARPFAELAREVARIAPQMTNAESQIRLLNQAYPQGSIAPGQLVKTIR